jgi:subtilisin family serine protease
MRYSKLFLILFLTLMAIIGPSSGLVTQAQSSQQLLLITVTPGTDMNAVAQAYQGKVLGSVGPNTYLVQAGTATPSTVVSGVLSVEPDSAVNPPALKGGIINVPAGTAPAWYSTQPEFAKVGIGTGYVSTGKGVVVADINSAVDFSHPALTGHLTAGYDFILGTPIGVGLDQSGSSFLNQSGSSFLNQSGSSFLNQSGSSFLNQSGSSFLNQSGSSFLNQSGSSFLNQSGSAFLNQSGSGFLDQSGSAFLNGDSPYLDPPTVAYLNQSGSGFLDQTTEKSIDSTNPYHGHGTMVAGVLAAVAPGAMIMPIRAFNDQGLSDAYTISKAIYWAVNNGANVINMSFGTLTNSGTLQGAIQYAQQNGVVLVGSAGNDDSSEQMYPSNYSGVLSAAATNYLDLKAQFSNYGDQVELSAPGVAIVTPYPGGYYAVVSGTSFSSPIVAGEAALILSQAISQGIAQQIHVADTIMHYTTNVSNINPGTPIGGRVNVNLSVRSITPPPALKMANANGQVGSPYSAAMTATGGFPPYTFSISSLPPGLTLNTSTGVISGIPTAVVNNLAVTGTVVDVTGVSATATGTLSIAAMAPLKLSISGSLNGVTGSPFNASLVATGGFAPYMFSISALPAGLTLNASTGAITGTPTTVSTVPATATVTDSMGASVMATGTFSIVPPPLQLQFPAANGEAGAPFTDTLTASGGYPPYTFSMAYPPTGLKVNSSTGVISGTPGMVGSSQVQATVTDSSGHSANANGNINIAAQLKLQVPGMNGGVGIPFSNAPNSNGVYANTMTATGGFPPYTFSISALPAGLSLNSSTGAVSGTPTASSSIKVTATVVDANGYSATASANINISATLKLQFSGTDGSVGTPYSNTLTATGGIPPYTFSVNVLPSGLSLNASTGAITGIPTTAVSNLSVTGTVTDSTGASVSATASISIQATLKLQFQPANGVIGAPYTSSISVTGGIPPYTFSSSALPAGLTLNSSTGAITGTPTTAVNNLAVTAKVVDSTGASVTSSSNITIATPQQLQLQIPGANGQVGTPYSSSLTAKGGVPPYTFSISALPAGLTLNGSTGTITGTPTAAVNNMSVVAKVVDSLGASATATGTISIGSMVTLQLKLSNLNGQVGVPFVGSMLASGGTAPYTFSISALPAGLTLDASAGSISGVPTAVSSLSVTATVVDSTGTSATATGTFKIVPPQLILQFPTANGEAGFPFSETLIASGGVPPYKFSLPYPPGGLNVNSSTGVISGKPSTAGSLQVQATVTDSTGASANANGTLNIAAQLQLQVPGINGGVGIAFSNAPNSNGVYANTLTAAGGYPPYTFSISALPTGLSLNSSTGAISGTPTASASLKVVATVTDSFGASTTANANINIASTLSLQISGTNGAVGTPFSGSLAATGGIAPYKFSISALPSGLSLSASTGVITGIPTSESSTAVTATVIDSTGVSVTATGTIKIGSASQLKLQFPGGSAMTGQAGVPYSISLTATGGFAPYTFSATSLPAGLTLNTSTGVISGTPTTPVTSFSVTATVADSVGTKATATGSITINP